MPTGHTNKRSEIHTPRCATACEVHQHGDFHIPLSQLMSADASCANCKAVTIAFYLQQGWMNGWMDTFSSARFPFN